MGLKVSSIINFSNLEGRLRRPKRDVRPILEIYGERGVQALRDATPVDTGETAASWYYDISRDGDTWVLTWANSNVQNGANIAVLLQTGHATTGGTWVQGIDYITPALQDIFKEFQIKIKKEVFG